MKNLKEAIKAKIKEEDLDIMGSKYNYHDICLLSMYLNEEDLINYSIEERNTDSDYWLQVEYYSEKLDKTIIYDYNYWQGETEEEAIDKLIELEKEIKDFEDRLMIDDSEDDKIAVDNYIEEITSRAEDLITAIEDNAGSGEIHNKPCYAVSLQYIADELEALKEYINNNNK